MRSREAKRIAELEEMLREMRKDSDYVYCSCSGDETGCEHSEWCACYGEKAVGY